MSTLEVKVPDIGDFTDVPVIEVFVKPGDTVKAEDRWSRSNPTRRPWSAGARRRRGQRTEGQTRRQGQRRHRDPDARVRSAAAPAKATAAPAQSARRRSLSQGEPPSFLRRQAQHERLAPAGAAALTAVKVPDIGDFKDVPIIEVFVKVGDVVKAEDSLVSLESEKATMDVPAPRAGVVKELKVKLGDKVSEGCVILMLEAVGAAHARFQLRRRSRRPRPPPRRTVPRPPAAAVAPHRAAPSCTDRSTASFKSAHASPSVRAFARELGVDLSRVKGSGPKDRILQEDVQKFVKGVMSGAAAAPATGGAGGEALGLLPWPKVDFSQVRRDREPSRCRASRRSRAPTCTATGC